MNSLNKWWLWFTATGICEYAVNRTTGSTCGVKDHVVFKKEVLLTPHHQPLGTKVENI